jgi:ERCC4-type nuclease
LVVEGRTRASQSGLLEWTKEVGGRSPKTICNWSDAGYGERRWTYQEVEHRLHTLELKAGLHVKRTDSTDATVALIAALYAWWHSDEWDDHTSHIAQATKYVRPSMGGPVLLTPPTLRERTAAQLPGLGAKNAAMVAGHFESVRDMINADASEWMKLPGIGKKVASGIIAAITGKNAA